MTNVKGVSVTDNSVLVLTNDGFVYGFGEMFVYNSRKIAQIQTLQALHKSAECTLVQLAVWYGGLMNQEVRRRFQ